MIELKGVTKDHRTKDQVDVPALRGIDLTIGRGEMVAIIGPSGSGTSTLMNILGLLDRPSDGRYLLDGMDVGRMRKRRLAKLRGRTIGFVFQSFDLMRDATVLRNLELPLLYTSKRARRARARRALERVGLADHEASMPVELFDAQRRKVLIARALINDAPVLLDEEPCGDLDAASAREVMELFTELNAAGLTIVFATHREETAAWAHRVVRLEDGRVVADEQTGKTPPPRLHAV